MEKEGIAGDVYCLFFGIYEIHFSGASFYEIFMLIDNSEYQAGNSGFYRVVIESEKQIEVSLCRQMGRVCCRVGYI